MSVNKQIICVLTGPLASFVVAVIACYVAFAYEIDGSIKFIVAAFLISSIVDLLVNLTPRNTPIKLSNGSVTFNYGHQLQKLLHNRQFSKEYLDAAKLFSEQKYDEASTIFLEILPRGFKSEPIFRLAISSFLQIKNYGQAKELIDSIHMIDAFITKGNLQKPTCHR